VIGPGLIGSIGVSGVIGRGLIGIGIGLIGTGSIGRNWALANVAANSAAQVVVKQIILVFIGFSLSETLCGKSVRWSSRERRLTGLGAQ